MQIKGAFQYQDIIDKINYYRNVLNEAKEEKDQKQSSSSSNETEIEIEIEEVIEKEIEKVMDHVSGVVSSVGNLVRFSGGRKLFESKSSYHYRILSLIKERLEKDFLIVLFSRYNGIGFHHKMPKGYDGELMFFLSFQKNGFCNDPFRTKTVHKDLPYFKNLFKIKCNYSNVSTKNVSSDLDSLLTLCDQLEKEMKPLENSEFVLLSSDGWLLNSLDKLKQTTMRINDNE